METLYTIEEVADILRCGREHVRNLCHSGKIPAINIGTRSQKCFRVSRSALEAYLSEDEPTVRENRNVEDSRFFQKLRAMRG